MSHRDCHYVGVSGGICPQGVLCQVKGLKSFKKCFQATIFSVGPTVITIMLGSFVLIVWQIKRQGNIKPIFRVPGSSPPILREGSLKFICFLQIFIFCAMGIGFRLVIKCKCLLELI